MSRLYKASTVFSTVERKILAPQPSFQVPPLNEARTSGRETERKGDLAAANQQASQIIADAEETAEKLLQQAREEIARLREENERQIEEWWAKKEQERQEVMARERQKGYEEGFQAGKKEGLAAAEKEYAERLQQANVILQEAYRQREEIIAAAEPFLLELGVEIAKKIIGKQLAVDRETVVAIVQQTLLRAKGAAEITIAVHPDDYGDVQKHWRSLLAAVPGHTQVRLVYDRSVEKGGCVIQTPAGTLDARIDTQLGEIKKALLQAAGSKERDGSSLAVIPGRGGA
ncbi:hypothetical protein BSNK01_20540 [Bacillaceae bacterium]